VLGPSFRIRVIDRSCVHGGITESSTGHTQVRPVGDGQWVGGYRVSSVSRVGLGLVLGLGPCFRVKVSGWPRPVG